ncbi:MAG: sulfatase-like hydrolase/transferase [Akkermansiaceae bacterium]|nr:sulfatase-like hydrolase/transferase [Akkermansiaceae bacterium]
MAPGRLRDGRPFPRCKTRLHDSGVKTPLVIQWPAGIPRAGAVCDSLVSVIDIAPTLLALAGLTAPESCQGVSLAPLLADPGAKVRQVLFAEHNWHGQIAHERMVRHGDYLYIRNANPQLPRICGLEDQCPQRELRALAAQGKLTPAQMDPLLEPRPAEELFLVTADPHQLRNLADAPGHRAALERMRAFLDDWQRRTGDTTPPLDEATPDRYDRRTGAPLTGRSGRPLGGTVPGEATGAPHINDPCPR